MAALVKTKAKRYVSVDLQNRGAKRFYFKQINKHGSLNGYITGIVHTVNPVFQHNPCYGKLRKIVLKEKKYDNDDSDDDEVYECPKLLFFTRGKVAEKCAEVKRGDTILLENPYVEFTNVEEPVYHLAGDKNLSDISVWAIGKSSTLLMGKDEGDDEEPCENGGHPEGNAQVSVVNTLSDSAMDDEEPSPSLLHSTRTLRSSSHYDGNNAGETDGSENELRVTRSTALQEHNVPKKSPKISRSNALSIQKTVASPAAKSSISSVEGKAKQSLKLKKRTRDENEIDEEVEKENSSTLRVTRSKASRVEVQNHATNTSENNVEQIKVIPESPMVLRNRKDHKTDKHVSSKTTSPKVSPRPSRKENVQNSPAVEVNKKAPLKRKTQSLSSQEENSEHESSQTDYSITSPALKRKKRLLFGHKGISSSPDDQPEITNVSLLQSSPKIQEPTKEDNNQNQQSNPLSDATHSKADNINSAQSSSRCLRSHNSNSSNVASADVGKNQERAKTDKSHNPVSDTANRKANSVESSHSSPHHLRSHASSSSNVASADVEMSQESNGDHVVDPQTINGDNVVDPQTINGDNVVDPQTITQPSTPSGTFQPTRRKGRKCGKNNKDVTPGTPGKAAAPKATKATTPSGTTTADAPGNRDYTDAVQGASNDVQAPGNNPTTNQQPPNQPITAPSTAINQPGPSTSTQNVPSAASNTPNTAQQSSIRDSYRLPANYTMISDVQVSTAVNLYGVVKFFKPPWKSRGTDMCCVVVLADPSTDEPLECVVFKDAVFLPQVRRIGDIVRLHRMNIKKYKDKLQALSTRGFSAVVFDRNVSIPVSQEEARFGTASFSFDSTDKDIVKTLKEWRISQPDLFEPAKFLTVSEIEPDLYFDIVCQVQGVYKQNNLDCVCLKVTDGTNPMHEIKSYQEDGSYEEVLTFNPNQCRFKVFDVFLYGDHALLLMYLKASIGTILFLHNVHSTVVQGGPGASLLDVVEPTLELCLHRGSEYGRGLVVLTQDSSDSQALLDRLK